MVTKPSFVYEGATPTHPLLGYLIDDGKKLKEKGVYSLTLARRVPGEASNGRMTVWYIIDAKNVVNQPPPRIAENKTPKIQQKKAIPKVEKVTGKKLFESGICTGVITSIAEIDGKEKYYCWLIDKHASTCIHDPKTDLLQGDFFKSTFKKTNQGKWNHVNSSAIRRVKKVMDFQEHENSIKFIIEVSEFIIGNKTEVEHEHFGRIIDIWDKLPKYALYAQSIKISVIQHRVDNRFRWVVFSVIG